MAELSSQKLKVPELTQLKMRGAGTPFRRVPPYFDPCMYILSAARNVAHAARDCIGDIRVTELFNGVTEQEAATSELYLQFYTLTVLTQYCSLMPVENK